MNCKKKPRYDDIHVDGFFMKEYFYKLKKKIVLSFGTFTQNTKIYNLVKIRYLSDLFFSSPIESCEVLPSLVVCRHQPRHS